MAQFVGLAASLATILTGSSTKDSSSKAGVKRSLGRPRDTLPLTIFVLGAVTALGIRSLLERYRICERLRQYIIPASHEDPTTALDHKEKSQVQSLLNANNSLSSHLYINKITLEPNKGLATNKSNGVEWMHLLKGTATLSIHGQESQTLEQDDHVMIPPWTERTIHNLGKSDLVFLLASDVTMKGHEVILLQENGLGQKIIDALQEEGSIVKGFQSISQFAFGMFQNGHGATEQVDH